MQGVQNGIDGILVSNHGGRGEDNGRSTRCRKSSRLAFFVADNRRSLFAASTDPSPGIHPVPKPALAVQWVIAPFNVEDI